MEETNTAATKKKPRKLWCNNNYNVKLAITAQVPNQYLQSTLSSRVSEE